MSPAAVDFRSPIASSSPASDDHRQSSAVFGCGNEHDRPSGARPRLLKIRRQFNGRSAVSAEPGSVFKPFRSDSSKDVCDEAGAAFVFGVGVVPSNMEAMSFKVEGLESRDGTFVFGVNGTQVNEVRKVENEKAQGSGFVFGASGGNNVGPNSELGKKGFDQCGVGSVTSDDNSTDVGMDTNGVGFEFGGGRNGSFDKRGNDERVLKPGLVLSDDCRMNVGALGPGFVFGSSWFECNLNEARKESGPSPGKSVLDDTGGIKLEREAELHTVKDTAVRFEIKESRAGKEGNNEGIFVFGSNGNRSSGFNGFGGLSCPNVEKSCSDASGSSIKVVKAQSCNLESSINDKFKASSFDLKAGGAGVFNNSPVFDLPREMRKLNISSFENVDGAEYGNSSLKDDAVFVFGSKGNANAKDSWSSKGQTHASRGADTISFQPKDENGTHKIGSFSVGISGSESFIFNAEHWSSSAEVQSSQGQVQVEMPTNMGSKATSGASQVPERVEKVSSESNSVDGLGSPFPEFQTPKWDTSCLKESLFPELQKKLKFDVKSVSKMDKKTRKLRRKLKQPSVQKQRQGKDHSQNVSTAQETVKSPGYSRMDFSPYRETTPTEQLSRGSSLASNSNHVDGNSGQVHPIGSAGLADERGLNLNDENAKSREPREDISGYYDGRCSSGSNFPEGLVFGAAVESSDFNSGQSCKGSGEDVVAGENTFSLNMESNNRAQFYFASGLVDTDAGKFSFCASSSVEKNMSSRRRLYRKKNRKSVLSEPSVIVPRPSADVDDQGQDLSSSQRKIGNASESSERLTTGSTLSTIELQEACETWQLRGNCAFKDGDMSKAEEFYTRGIDSVASCMTSGYCIEPLVICYSNRAATRMSLGNIREAIRDCSKAAALDPNFLKVQIRAANCHLILGEVENALKCFHTCLESDAGVCLDRRTTIEAADGLQRAQKVAECISCAAKLLEQKTPDAALSGLDVTAEALTISPKSERLLEIKAEFMLVLHKYEEVIQLCECTLGDADKNFTSAGSDEQSVDIADTKSKNYSLSRLWRWHLISKTYFYMGRLEKALVLLEKLQQMRPLSCCDRDVSTLLESSGSLAVTIRDLLNHKSAGNVAVQSGRYEEAVEHYTTALSSNLEARPFAAICLGNRAAGYQALGQIANAIADCSLAIALDKNYAKAVSRRATLHEMIRDYGQAAIDLQRLISIIESQSDKKDGQSGTPGRLTSSSRELRQAQRRLCSVEEEAKNGISLDFCLILGVKESDSTSDVKKAYRKAALRHHPDKACQYVARSESGHEGQLWKEILQEVHVDADRLFKMIGEAYTVLSDPSKRQQYDLDEEIRKAATKQKHKSSSWKRTPDSRGFPFDRSNQRQNWDNWKTYGNSHSPW